MAVRPRDDESERADRRFLEGLLFDRVTTHALAAHRSGRDDRATTRDTVPDGARDSSASDESSAEEQEWSIHAGLEADNAHLRVRLRSSSPISHYLADLSVRYQHDRQSKPELSEAATLSFVRDIAFPALLPFLRETLFDAARRLDLPPPALPSAFTPEEMIEALSKRLQRQVG